MIRSAQALVDWLERCPKGRSVTLRYLNSNPLGTVEYIKSDLLKEIAEIASEDLLFIPDATTDADPKPWRVTMTEQLFEQHSSQNPLGVTMITNLTVPDIPASGPADEPEPIKRLADPLRDPKLDWLRSKG